MAWKVSGSQGAQSTNAAAWQQRQQNFQALQQALKSNNLDAAKTAYASLTANTPPNALSNPNSPLAQLGKALQSGDLAAAQQAFSNLRGSHRGASTQSASALTSPPPAPNPTDTSGNNVNLYV